jgi:acetyltransferase-like isoleucine patch superfamily enzyme
MIERLLDALHRCGARHPRIRPLMAAAHRLLGGNRMRAPRRCLDAREAFLRRVRLDVKGPGHRIEVRPGARVSDTLIHLHGRDLRVVIGEDCRIKAGVLWLEDTGSELWIGSDTTIEQAGISVIEGRSVSIGRDCMIAYDVEIRSGDSHPIRDRATGAVINPGRDVRIGDHVWLGAHVQVLKGAVIRDGAVVGVGSMVTGEVPAHVVAGGVPARVLHEDIDWDRRRGFTLHPEP